MSEEEIAAMKAELTAAREELEDMDRQINLRMQAQQAIDKAIARLDEALEARA